MDRPIPRYLDYLIAVSAESFPLLSQRERDALLLRAIRLQSFGRMRPVTARGERPDEGVCTGTDIPLSHNVGADMHWTERVPILRPTPKCRPPPMQPPLIRFRDAPRYLGMDRKRSNVSFSLPV